MHFPSVCVTLSLSCAHRKLIPSHQHAAQCTGHVPAQTGSALGRWETLCHGQRRRQHNSGGRTTAAPPAKIVWNVGSGSNDLCVFFFPFQDHYGSWFTVCLFCHWLLLELEFICAAGTENRQSVLWTNQLCTRETQKNMDICCCFF